jgi:hypothetical protein
VGGRRELLEVEPSDVVVLLGCDVRRRADPVTHQPGADECPLARRSRRDPTQVSDRVRRDLDAELLAKLPDERLEL